MINLSFQIAIIIALTLLNGLLAMSETALVSSRKARLKQRADAGDRKSRTALELADELMIPRHTPSPSTVLRLLDRGIPLFTEPAGGSEEPTQRCSWLYKFFFGPS